MSGSTIAVATENMSSICRTDPALAEIYKRVVREGLNIARAHGYALDDTVDADKLLARLVDHKPSLLQDYEQRRPMEVAEIIEAPIAFARAQNVPTPTLDTLAAIVGLCSHAITPRPAHDGGVDEGDNGGRGSES
jgi:2-dehydropantoate 2-reductase